MLNPQLRPVTTSAACPLDYLQTITSKRKQQLQEIQSLFEESQKLLREITDAKKSPQELFPNEFELLASERNLIQSQSDSIQEKKEFLKKKIDTLSIEIDREIINRQQFLKHLKDSLEIKFSFYFQKKQIEIAALEKKIQQVKTFETDFNKKTKELESIVQSWERKINQLQNRFFAKQDPYESLKKDLRKDFLKIIFCKESKLNQTKN